MAYVAQAGVSTTPKAPKLLRHNRGILNYFQEIGAFRILQNNSNSFHDIVLNTEFVPDYSIIFSLLSAPKIF